MPFQYTLANVLADAHGSIAVLFVDETGETVDLACSEFAPYDMKIAGAYIGIYLRQFRSILERSKMGEPELLHIEKPDMQLLAVPLPDEYFLVLVQRRPAMAGQARRVLLRAQAEIAREIFEE